MPSSPSRRSIGRAITAVLSSCLLGLVCLPAPLARADATTVREPAFGLPHFFADTDLELARENGREIARDRLAQLILLARVGRGTLAQAFGSLLSSAVGLDLEARQTGYTSSELNDMWAKLPEAERELILEYCRGVNDTLERIYAGELPEPLEVDLLRRLGLGADLFGNATNISDQVDPFYRAPGGADPERPNAGFQFTPEMAVSVGVLQVRNFGLGGFDEASRLEELQQLIAARGEVAGTQLWEDLNFANDPLAPVSVPDDTTPGFGGPLAQRAPPAETARLVRVAKRFPRHEYIEASRRVAARRAERAEVASRLGAWPKLGSYAWAIAGSKSATGHPWIGGFPQTGIQTPSLMHFAENRSLENVRGIGMEFAGAPLILIGQTDSVAWTTTTAQLPVVDTFLEEVVGEDADALRYLDEGTPAALSMRKETILAPVDQTRVLWRSHARGGDGGSRPIVEFLGDADGTAEGGTATTLVDSGAFDGSLAGGHVALVDGAGAGQIRAVDAVPDADTLSLGTAWSPPPDATTTYVAVGPGTPILAVAIDSPAWRQETTTVLGFSRFQQATRIEDVRAGVRLMPTTHNFLAADNRGFNGFGTAASNGNIGFWSSGFARIRQGGQDPRLPLDGAVANPLVVRSGTLDAGDATTLTAGGAFAGLDLGPQPVNFRYDDPTRLGSEFIVTITSGTGAHQTRRIASNTDDVLVVESPFGVAPAAGDGFAVYEVIGMPEAQNPEEGYTANWNNKAATADPGDTFGRQHRSLFLLERLAAEDAWDRAKQRRLNADVAGLDGKGAFGRFLVPRLRQAVDAVGDGGNPDVAPVLAGLEAHLGAPSFGRRFVDPVVDTHDDGEIAFLNDLVRDLVEAIYGDEYAGAVDVPGGSDALHLVQHAIDSAAADVPGAYLQAFADDYFDGVGWETLVRDTFAALASGGIPADGTRGETRYEHPLALLDASLVFPPTPEGNRGVWEQIVEVGDVVRGEFIFPLGQSGLITGSPGSLGLGPHVTSLHPIWRDWRFVPMITVSQDLESSGSEDGDGDGVFDAFERWYFDDTSPTASADGDGDGASLLAEFEAGSDPTDPDTDDDLVLDGSDSEPQNRLLPEPGPALQALAMGLGLGALARRRRAADRRARAQKTRSDSSGD